MHVRGTEEGVRRLLGTRDQGRWRRGWVGKRRGGVCARTRARW
jgi:hypothetical protein